MYTLILIYSKLVGEWERANLALWLDSCVLVRDQHAPDVHDVKPAITAMPKRNFL